MHFGDDRAQGGGITSIQQSAGDFLKHLPAVPSCKPELRGKSPAIASGKYKLLQKIGEGGCGVVFMAEQEEPVRRRVALKVIKLGHGHEERHRALRGRAAGAGADGSSEHRARLRRRRDRQRAGRIS